MSLAETGSSLAPDPVARPGGQLPPAPAAQRRDAPPGTGTAEIPCGHGFLSRLVSPEVVDSAARCPGGVASVVMKQSLLNFLTGAVTFGD